jgi:hypothetical protein
MYWISAATAERLRLETRECAINGGSGVVADIPDYQPARSIPPPMQGACGLAVMVNPQDAPRTDGQLGASYLLGRIWTFDYPAGRLAEEPAKWVPEGHRRSVPLGLPRDKQGVPGTGFARITVWIDAKAIDMLLDTGATGHPTKLAAKAGVPVAADGYTAASFITSSLFERLRKSHPDWQVLQEGDDLFKQHVSRMIRVPAVEVAGYKVGPVWFTERPDRAFHVYMSSLMDKPVDGAIGGNVLQNFVVTIDYPGAKAYFYCPDGCAALDQR